MIVAGLMSGTSADGTDVAIADINGAPPELCWKLLHHAHFPHDAALRAQIFAAFRPESARVDMLCELNFALGEAFARAALGAIREAGLTPGAVELIGSHGQTVWHVPRGAGTPSTLQLGSPAVIAERTGITVVSDFRARDIAAGGEGAPLVPYVDYLFLSHPEKTRCVQNIGGIANVCYLPARLKAQTPEGVLAFDTGPGNMLIDYGAQRITGGALLYDRDGLIAASGTPDTARVARWLSMPYFAKKPPKSTGRELFGVQLGAALWAQMEKEGLCDADKLATFTYFTAASIANAYRAFLPKPPDEVILCGGGAKNPALLRMLEACYPVCYRASGEVGIQNDAKEAMAFAVLAYETFFRRMGSLPSATGARHASMLGSVTFAR